MKRFLLIVLLLSAAGGGWWYFINKKAETPEYNTESVAKGDITQIVTATGSLKPVINVTVGCQISGTIDKLFADFNSVVKEGDVLASMDPSTYEAIVQQAEGELANSKATLELAEITAQRKEELLKQKAASQASPRGGRNQGRRIKEGARRPQSLHHLLAHQRNDYFPKRGCWPNRGGLPERSEFVHHRQRHDQHANCCIRFRS
ncbi:MAG: biotin/lipoyl-binding protein [Proteobacteria bacterium]|nr:biotin/lipoyl-binding protein [Pseudomonadota bacterium]